MTIRMLGSFVLFFALVAVSPAADGGVGTGKSFRGPVGLQTYSLRNQIRDNGAKAFDYIKEQGFKYVEIGLGSHYGMSREELKETLKKLDLIPIAALGGHGFLLNNTDEAIEEAEFFGIKYVGTAWADHQAPMNEAQMLKIADEFNTIGKRLKEKGIQFFYHNHGFEFYPYKDGLTLFDLLMEKTDPDLVKYEMDTTWVVHPGQDPVKLLRKYPDRWIFMHLKDLKKGVASDLSGTTDVENDVPLGTGQIDWVETLKAAQEIGIKYYFIEDESSNVLKQIPQTLRYLESIEF